MTQEGTKTSDQANFEGYLSHCDQSFENKFIDILKNADFNSHPSPLLRNNLSEPKVIEVIAYLKLLKAFKVLKIEFWLDQEMKMGIMRLQVLKHGKCT